MAMRSRFICESNSYARKGARGCHRSGVRLGDMCVLKRHANFRGSININVNVHVMVYFETSSPPNIGVFSPMPSDETKLMTIRDAAERLQVTPRTLKYYEELGLITPTRSEGRYRLYGEHDLERFARILRLRSLGFSLQGIAEMLKRPLEPVGEGRKGYSMASLREIEAALTQQIEGLDTRISAVRRELKEAQALRRELGDDLDYLRRRIAGEKQEDLLSQRIAARKRRHGSQSREGAAE